MSFLRRPTPSWAPWIRGACMTDLDGNPTLSVQDVAASLALSYHAVLRAAHRGDVVGYKICGRVRFRKEDVHAWIERSRIELEEDARKLAAETALPPTPGSREALRATEHRLRRG